MVCTGKLYLLYCVTTTFTDRSPHLSYKTQIIKQWLHERLGVTSHLSTKAYQKWDILYTVTLHLMTNHDLVAFIETNVTASIRWYIFALWNTKMQIPVLVLIHYWSCTDRQRFQESKNTVLKSWYIVPHANYINHFSHATWIYIPFTNRVTALLHVVRHYGAEQVKRC